MTQPMPPNPNLPPEQLPDVSPLADAHQAALADLQQEWAGLTDKQKAALVDAVYTAVAAGTVADLLTLPVDITGTSAALTAAMVAIAATAAHLLAAEAADQGVHVPAVHVPAAVFEPTAQVVAGTLGDELRITAARAALQYGPDANPTDVADAARAALDARSGASETKQLGGALHGAMNTGRLASLRRAPTGAVYAQEMNDKNTCGPCREVNGRWLGNIPDDLPQILAMYPDGAYGGYISCLGGINCRGTITGVWRPDQVEAANRRRMLGEFNPDEPRDPATGEWIGEELEHVAHKLVDSTKGGGHHVAAYDDYDGNFTNDGHPGRVVAVAMDEGGRAPWKDADAPEGDFVVDRRDAHAVAADMEGFAATARDFRPTPEQVTAAEESGPILIRTGQAADHRIAAYHDVNGDLFGENTPFIAIQSETISSARARHAQYPDLYKNPEDWTGDILGAPIDVLTVDARKVPGLADAIRRMADTTAVATASPGRILAKGGQHRDHHKKPDYTAADVGVSELHSTDVDPQDVNVDRQHYQRDLDPDEVDRFRQHPKRLAKRWGLLARRPDGSLWVVNGQHHTQAGVDEGIRQMRYRVFDSSGPAQEGKVYAAYQRWHDGWHAARPDEPRNRVAAEFNPDQPRDPDGKWSKLGALVAGIASGIAHEDQLGGGQQGVTKLAVFNNGTTGIHKTVSDLTSYTMRPAKHDVDAEELAADLAHRLGIVSPTVHRDGEHSFWQSVVPGTLGASLDEAQAAKLADTDQGRVVGLLDIILNNHDRNPGNWLAEHPDNPHAPGIGVIDHGMAFDTQSGHEIYGALDAFGTDDFVRHYKVRNPDPVDGPDSPYVFGDNDLSPQDIRTAKKALTEMRSEFERLGHLDWWELAYARLAAVGEHAAGTKVRIHA